MGCIFILAGDAYLSSLPSQSSGHLPSQSNRKSLPASRSERILRIQGKKAREEGKPAGVWRAGEAWVLLSDALGHALLQPEVRAAGAASWVACISARVSWLTSKRQGVQLLHGPASHPCPPGQGDQPGGERCCRSHCRFPEVFEARVLLKLSPARTGERRMATLTRALDRGGTTPALVASSDFQSLSPGTLGVTCPGGPSQQHPEEMVAPLPRISLPPSSHPFNSQPPVSHFSSHGSTSNCEQVSDVL